MFKNPFTKLVEAFQKWWDGSDMLGNANLSVPPEPRDYTKLTYFERQLVSRFDELRNDPKYFFMYVSILPKPNGAYKYTDHLLERDYKADFNILACPIYFNAAEVVRREQNAGHMVVMMLDLHGAELEKQIPGWKPGQIEFPVEYIYDPLISVPDAPDISSNGAYLSGIMTTEQVADRKKRAAASILEAPKAQTIETIKDNVIPTLSEDFKPATGIDKSGNAVRMPSYIRGVVTNEHIQSAAAPKANMP